MTVLTSLQLHLLYSVNVSNTQQLNAHVVVLEHTDNMRKEVLGNSEDRSAGDLKYCTL